MLMLTGSRSIESMSVIVDAFNLCPFDPDKVIHGGADGVDSLGDTYCSISGIETISREPKYEKYGSRAPLERNTEMVKEADAVLAVWDGESNGTRDSIQKALESNTDIFVHFA